jgi:uncharacterized membrane protein (DUF373 family)
MNDRRLTSYLDGFEKIITTILVVLMAAVVTLATVELGWILVKDVLTPPILLLEIDELLELFGLFLLVLIGIELLHSVKTYLEHRQVHLQAVLAVALIAIARKIVIVDPVKTDQTNLIGIAGVVLALTIGYYLVRRVGPNPTGPPPAAR